MKKNILVIGYGSIGRRHASLAMEMGHSVGVVSAHTTDSPCPCWKSLEEAPLKNFDIAIIASATSLHADHLETLSALGFCGSVMVEKPLFQNASSITPCGDTFVGYNLRFHPVIQEIRRMVGDSPVLSIQAYAGQYLPTWRPGTDYAKSYSASRTLGGGVLRDLSHELDLVQHIAGSWARVTATGGKFSTLAGDSDDIFLLLLECARCPAVSIHLNYLDKAPHRHLLVNTEEFTLMADLVGQTLSVNADPPRTYECKRDTTYAGQLHAICEGRRDTLCSFSEGIQTVFLIEAAEKAAREKIWIQAEHSL